MKFYEFVVTKSGWMMGSYKAKAAAIAEAKRLMADWPGEVVSIKAHVYGVPLDQFDVGDHYLYSYDVEIA